MCTPLNRFVAIRLWLQIFVRYRRGPVVKVLPVLLFACLQPASASAFPQSVTLQCAELNESSGLAVSQYDANLVWTHNDSGGKPQLYLFDRADGSLRCQAELHDVKAIDWEDMCAFQVNGIRYLAVGDVGDNARKRKNVQIHILEEPQPPRGSRETTEGPSEPKISAEGVKVKPSGFVLNASPLVTLEVEYPDGAKDCESLAFDSQFNRFLLLSKELFRCRIYGVRIDLQLLDSKNSRQPPQKIALRADYLQSMAIPLATAADYCPVSHRLVVCTYRPAYLLERDGQGWSERKMKMVSLPNRRQGEAIAFAGLDSLLVTSEIAPTPLWTVSIPPVSKEK